MRLARKTENLYRQLYKAVKADFSNIRFGGKIGDTFWANMTKTALYNKAVSNSLVKCRKITYRHLLNNESGIENLYVTADGRKKVVPFCIDIDCKKCGSADGSMALANHLASLLKLVGVNSYAVQSTNGIGAHLWLFIENDDQLRDSLIKWANAHGRNFDIEFVEGKCSPISIKYKWSGRKVIDAEINMGTLCKLPGDLRHRLSEWQDAKSNYARKNVSLTMPKINAIEETAGFSIVVPERQTKFGSCDMLADLPEKWQSFVDFANVLKYQHSDLFGGFNLNDIAAWSACLWYLTKNANADDQMPRERIKSCWNEIAKHVDINGWHNAKHVALRQAFEQAGLVDMVDNTYHFVPAHLKKEGRKGRAMKWKGSDMFMAVFENDNRERVSSVLLNNHICESAKQIVPSNAELVWNLDLIRQWNAEDSTELAINDTIRLAV